MLSAGRAVGLPLPELSSLCWEPGRSHPPWSRARPALLALGQPLPGLQHPLGQPQRTTHLFPTWGWEGAARGS